MKPIERHKERKKNFVTGKILPNTVIGDVLNVVSYVQKEL